MRHLLSDGDGRGVALGLLQLRFLKLQLDEPIPARRQSLGEGRRSGHSVFFCGRVSCLTTLRRAVHGLAVGVKADA